MLEFLGALFFELLVNILFAIPGGLLRTGIYWVKFRGRKNFRAIWLDGNSEFDALMGGLMLCLFIAFIILW